MRHPLLPVSALVALVILVCEGFFGLFSKLADPMRSPTHYVHYVDGSEQWIHLRVSDIPEPREKTLRMVAEVLDIADSGGATYSSHGKMLIYIEKPSSIAVGDELLVLAQPRLPSGAENPHQFDYRRHLFRKGILYTCYIPSDTYRIIAHNNRGLKAKATTLRKRLVDVIHFSALTPSQQGIAEALILGWNGDLDGNTQAQFRSAGISHLLCVSGLHVGIVALLVGWCLFFMSNRRAMRIIKGLIQIFAIWAFVVITGMAPATMRAGLMFTFIVIGQMFFSRPPTLNAIAASALVLLVYKPLLLFDAGFQLSYVAVISIVVLEKPLESLMPIPDGENLVAKTLFSILKKIRSLLCVSIVAQLATTPLTLFYFHSFAPYFLVANMTVIPFATLMLGSVMLMLAVCWWPMAFKAAGALASFFLGATERITETISLWPFALVEGVYFDGTMLLLFFSIILLLGWTLAKKSWYTAIAALVISISFVIYARRVEARCVTQLHSDIYRVGNRTAIEYFVGHESYLLCDTATAKNPDRIDYQTSNNLIWHQVRQRHILPLDTSYNDGHLFVKDRFVGFDGHRMRIVDRSNYRYQSQQRIKLDYILLRESPFITIAELQHQYDFDTLIISSQNSQHRIKEWQRQCDLLGVPYRH